MNDPVVRFGENGVVFNTINNKWIISTRDFINKEDIDLFGWTITRHSVIDVLEKIATTLESDIEKKYPLNKITREKKLDPLCGTPRIIIYIEEPGLIYGYYPRKEAYRLTGHKIPKIEIRLD